MPVTMRPGKPVGLYHPDFERDNCGVGFIAHIKGASSHQIVADALQMLINMDHRGACGCEANTGDGAGILTAIPDAFFRRVTKLLGIVLPEKGRYGTGNFFFKHDDGLRAEMKRKVEEIVAEEGQLFLGWRDVPTDPIRADLGPTAPSSRSRMRVLVARSSTRCSMVSGPSSNMRSTLASSA